MKIENGIVTMTFDFYGKEFEYKASYEECVCEFIKNSTDIEGWIAEHGYEIESVFWDKAMADFDEYYYVCDFCGKPQLREEREDDYTMWELCNNCAREHLQERE